MDNTYSPWNNCSNDDVIEALADCPEIVAELKKTGYQDLVNAYDAILPQFNMDRITSPVYKENSDELTGFAFWYRIDNNEFSLSPDKGFLTKAEAQLASINETKAELRSRLLKRDVS